MRRVYILIVGVLLLAACGPVFTVEVVNGTPAASQPTAPAEAQAGQKASAECAGSAQTQAPGACQAESILSTIVTYLTFFAELCGAIVIGVAVLRALARFIPHIVRRETPNETYTENIRLQLGKSLALALEFELGADILKTAVAPTLTVIAQLAAIAILRTFLNYFLERELRQAERRRGLEQTDHPPATSPAARP